MIISLDTLGVNVMAQEHIIRFGERHNLDIYIYDASDAYLRYSNTFTGSHTRESDDEPRDVAPSKKPGDEENMKARMGTYPVFAGPVRLSWHDLNDEPIEYTFDFNDIFPDKSIPYPKELEDRIIWEEPLDGDPGIILEIIDRTLNIYTLVDLDTLIPETNNIKSVRYHEKVFTKEF
jgi:hypothetical protein